MASLHSQKTSFRYAAELAWLTRLRWVTLAFFSLAGAVGFSGLFLVQQWAIPYFLTCLFLALFNLRSVLRAQMLSPEQLTRETVLAVSIDLFAVGAWLAFTGGSRSPAFVLLIIPAAMGALFLTGISLAVFAGLLMMVIGLLFMSRNLQILSGNFYASEVAPVVAVALSLATTFGIIVWLARTLRTVTQKEERALARDHRLENLLAAGALAADFSHRFATPLNNVALRLRRARSRTRQEDVELSAELRAAEESNDQCASLLREIVSVTLDASYSKFERVDVGELLISTAKHWNDTEPGTYATVRVESKQPLKCRLPPLLVAKAFTNLLENSSQHQRRGGEIVVDARGEGDFAIITFIDEGPGWPTTLLRDGVRPFASSRPGGTGLGLYNTLSLCEALGGTFEIANEPGRGAKAILRLPLDGATLSV